MPALLGSGLYWRYDGFVFGGRRPSEFASGRSDPAVFAQAVADDGRIHVVLQSLMLGGSPTIARYAVLPAPNVDLGDVSAGSP
jgi:hypothetical protein